MVLNKMKPPDDRETGDLAARDPDDNVYHQVTFLGRKLRTVKS